MASEIVMQASLTHRRYSPPTKRAFSLTITQSGNRSMCGVQEVGTSAEQISIGDVSAGTLGYILIRNMDATNYVQIALDSGVSTQIYARLRAGQFCILPPETNTIYGKANTAAVNIEVMAIEL